MNLLLFLDNNRFVILWAAVVVFRLAATLTFLFGYIRTFSSLAYIIATGLLAYKVIKPPSWFLDLLHESMLVNKLERKWNNLLFLQLLHSSLVLFFLPFKLRFDIVERH